MFRGSGVSKPVKEPCFTDLILVHWLIAWIWRCLVEGLRAMLIMGKAMQMSSQIFRSFVIMGALQMLQMHLNHCVTFYLLFFNLPYSSHVLLDHVMLKLRRICVELHGLALYFCSLPADG